MKQIHHLISDYRTSGRKDRERPLKRSTSLVDENMSLYSALFLLIPTISELPKHCWKYPRLNLCFYLPVSELVCIFVLIGNGSVKEPTDSITELEGEDDEGGKFLRLLCEYLLYSSFVFWVDEIGLLPEPNESSADDVYRYIEGIVARAVVLHQHLEPGLIIIKNLNEAHESKSTNSWTHSTIYPWCPPRIRVSLGIL